MSSPDGQLPWQGGVVGSILLKDGARGDADLSPSGRIIDPGALAESDPSPSVQGIDVVFGGHLHIVLNPPQDIPHYNENGDYLGHTVVVHSGAFAKYVGRLDLVIHLSLIHI